MSGELTSVRRSRALGGGWAVRSFFISLWRLGSRTTAIPLEAYIFCGCCGCGCARPSVGTVRALFVYPHDLGIRTAFMSGELTSVHRGRGSGCALPSVSCGRTV